MLVLSRQPNESIVIDIGGGIKITVTEITRDNVRLGFEADREIGIYRSEVWRAIQERRTIEDQREDGS